MIYICGSDEHGVPITVTADNENISPQDVVDRYHAMNKQAFQKLGIDFDNYSRTSLKLHHETAQEFFTTLNDRKELSVKESEQFYSETSKRFLPDRYVEGTCPYCGYEKARGDQCDACGKWLEPSELHHPVSKIDGSKPVLKKTRHWYFPMGKFSDIWQKWFNAKSWKENVRNYCMGWYNEGLGDRPITRDLHWGVPVPLDDAEGKVLYVWFDAPIGYISSTKEWAQKKGEPDLWKKYWLDPETRLVHFIGKDNIVFHAILFPMMLMRMGGYVLPDAIPANEYLTIEGRKISTSQNYAVWVKDYLEKFPPDPLRYTLAVNTPETRDTDFSWTLFQSRNNDELADILGNFVNRTVTFVHKYYEGIIPKRGQTDKLDKWMLDQLQEAPDKMGDCLEKFEIRSAARAFMDLCRSANKYFNDKAPWETRKSDPDSCATTLNICIQVSRALGTLMSPIIPFSAEKVNIMLNCSGVASWDDIAGEDLPEGHRLGETEILFSKIDDEVIQKEVDHLAELAGGQEEKMKETLEIDIDTFRKVHMQTATVLEAEKVEGADKLLKLKIDIGQETRQIVAGVAQSYQPEEIIGKTIVVVSNLKPTKIRGIESQGMLLAVQTGERHTLVTTSDPADPGIRVS